MAVEPWLRGPLEGVNPSVAPLFFSFEQIREDLARHTEGLSAEQIWSRPLGIAPLGFQMRHIAGSIGRLATYLRGEALSEAQMAEAGREFEPGASREELLLAIEQAMKAAEEAATEAARGSLGEPRAIGCLRLPTTVMGLIVHIAEHSQRHLGAAIVTSRLLRAWPGPW
jgi:hypothetical protein